MDSKIYLSVMSDDFGMCEAVNDGVIQAFTNGVLTDTNLMAPAPMFLEASHLATRYKIPVGIHITFTAEWDFLRWKPLTPLKSMTRPDGTFAFTVKEAWKKADMSEAEVELEAQWKRIEDMGLSITHACEHMNCDRWGKLAKLLAVFLRKKKTPTRNKIHGEKFNIPRTNWISTFETSGQSLDREVTKRKLKMWIDSLGPGHHLWQCHCAVDDPALEKICRLSHKNFNWTRAYRVIDLSLVLDPEVRNWIKKRDIELVPISACPVVGFDTPEKSSISLSPKQDIKISSKVKLKTISFEIKRHLMVIFSRLLPKFFKKIYKEKSTSGK